MSAEVPFARAAGVLAGLLGGPPTRTWAQALRKGTWGLCVQQALGAGSPEGPLLCLSEACVEEKHLGGGRCISEPRPAPSPSAIFTLPILLQRSKGPSWVCPARLESAFYSESPGRHLSLTSKLFRSLVPWNPSTAHPPSDSLRPHWAATE